LDTGIYDRSFKILKKKGFTLIELLVVIAIIALLLSILMPALGKVKLIAKEVLCKSNLHQYTLATEMYVNDQDGFLPFPWMSLYGKIEFSGEVARYCRWHNPEFDLGLNADKEDTVYGTKYAGPYWPYLAMTKANVCPTFAMYAKKYAHFHPYHDTAVEVGPPTFSYGMNGNLHGTTSVGFGEYAVSAKKTRVKNPSGTFLWGEENMWVMRFGDGRADTTLSESVLNDNGLHVANTANGFGADTFGSFHGASSSQIAAELPPGEAHPGAKDYGEYQEAGFTHLLMVDGSLTTGTPEDSKRYGGKRGGY
jgi:prepilin-type N-terminal cleavage/methylation domain-containing protein